MCRSTAVFKACAAARLHHSQRSVGFRLCYCLCLLPCSKCHSDVIIFFLNLECHQSDILVRLIRDTDTYIHHNDAHRHVWFLSCTHGALNCSQLPQLRLQAVGLGTLFILLSLFCFFMSPFPHLLIRFLLPHCQEVPFKHLSVFPRRPCKTAVFLQSVFCLCI